MIALVCVQLIDECTQEKNSCKLIKLEMKIFGEQSVKNTICRIRQIAFPRPTLCPLHALAHSELGHGTKEPWP